MFYVYELRDDLGKTFYVGKGSKLRMQSHKYRAKGKNNSHLCCKIRKIWASGKDYTAHIVFRSQGEAVAFEEEKRLIALYGRNNLTNKTDGGDGASGMPQESKERIAASRRGKVASAETRERQRLAALGRKVAPETKAKIAKSSTGLKKPWAREHALKNLKKMSSAGRKWTARQRELFHAARVGHAVSQETRDKISQSKKGTPPWNKKPLQPTP